METGPPPPCIGGESRCAATCLNSGLNSGLSTEHPASLTGDTREPVGTRRADRDGWARRRQVSDIGIVAGVIFQGDADARL